MFIWIFVILALFTAALLFGMLYSQNSQIRKREGILLEAFWRRRNKLPLLLEVINRGTVENGQGSHPDKSLQAELIKSRAELDSGAYFLDEIAVREKKVTEMISNIIGESRTNEKIRSDAMFLALENEFVETHSAIDIALNDYNYSVQEWKRMCSCPWFKIIEIFFDSRKRRAFQPV